MDQAAHEASTGVDGWAEESFAVLGRVPDVSRVGLALLEGGGRRLRFTATERRSGSDLGWCHVDAYDDVPLNVAVRTAAPVIGSLEELRPRYAGFVDAQRDTPHVAVAAIPITASGAVLGGFVLFFDQPQSFPDRQRAELTRVGHRLGAGLRSAYLRGGRRPAEAGSAEAGSAEASSAGSTPPGALVAVQDVPADLAAVGDARGWFRETLAGWGIDRDRADTATLCLSELVTNAVIHAHGGCAVRVVVLEGELTVQVRDSGIVGAVPLEPSRDPLEVHGRGLQLVEALATRWGYDTDPEGASVWFTLDVG